MALPWKKRCGIWVSSDERDRLDQSMKFVPTIGLEIHAELATKTKMFCVCRNESEPATPNLNICPICLAHPGALPMINREAVRQVLRVGLALGGRLADYTEFDRKSYFYPDIPKGYQISQYEHPLVLGGELNGVAIKRVHLEEDTARSIHDSDPHYSLIDFNRAGVPLMELVTEPVLKTAAETASFARELQLLLRYLGASAANMERGEMRVEANISLSRFNLDNGGLGTKVEVKNLNSFRSVERAIEYEIKRQSELLEAGKEITQETRGWDEGRSQTFSQRLKESSDDYRYFPEPDLPAFQIGAVQGFQNLVTTLPELPWTKRVRYHRDYGLKPADIEILVSNLELSAFFEEVSGRLGKEVELIKLAVNYLINDLAKLAVDGGGLKIEVEDLAELVRMVNRGELSSRGVKDLLAAIRGSGRRPRELARDLGLMQKSDEGELQKIVLQIIADNQKVAEDYRAGKTTALQFLVGVGMRLSKGSANPQILESLLKKALK